MALDPMIARGVQGVDFTNTLAQVGQLRQRDRMLDQDEAQNAFVREKYNAQQAGAQAAQQSLDDLLEEAETAFEQGGVEAAKRYIPRLAAIDPQMAQVVLKSYEDDAKQYSLQTQQGPFGSQIITDGSRFQVVEPPKPDTPREPPQPQLKDVTLPDGTVQSQWLRPGESTGVPVGQPTKKPDRDAQKVEIQLTGDFVQQSKTFDTVAGQYRRVLEVAKVPSPANDYALIYAFAKIQDPTSVVRESEFATAAQTGAYGEKIKAAVTKVANGQTLTATQRADFLNAAKNAYKAQEQQWKSSVVGPAYQQAKAYNLNWKNVFRDYRVNPSGAKPKPQPQQHPSGATYTIED